MRCQQRQPINFLGSLAMKNTVVHIADLGAIPGAPLVPACQSWYGLVKAPCEYFLACILLVLTSPLLLLASLAVKLTSRGPVLYSQTRLGRNGRPYAIYKIRTMYHNCECQSGVCWSTKGDQRVTS